MHGGRRSEVVSAVTNVRDERWQIFACSLPPFLATLPRHPACRADSPPRALAPDAVRPPTALVGRLYDTSLALDPNGFIAVHPTLESVNTPGVFAAGDVAAVLEHPRPKAGVFAVRQGTPLTNNLKHSLRGEALAPFIPQSTFLGLIGGGDMDTCVASRGLMALESNARDGGWLWTLKDWIDRTWMHAYTTGLPPPMSKMNVPPPSAVALASGSDALDALAHASMRCGGCGAKVGVSVLQRVMQRLKEGDHLPEDPPEVRVPRAREPHNPMCTAAPLHMHTVRARPSPEPPPSAKPSSRRRLIHRSCSASTPPTTAQCSRHPRSPQCTPSTSSALSSTTPSSSARSPPTTRSPTVMP